MRSRILKISRTRIVALAVGVGVIGSLATAPASFAGVPLGAGCVASDGKISGRGSTFQAPAFASVFIPGYENDICGSVPLQYTGDPAGSTMIAYNYNVATTTPQHVALTGSGQGEQAMACRSDAFGGTDLPYDEARLTTLWGATGTWNFDGFTNCDPLRQSANATPPYTPAPNAATPFYPSTVGGVTNATSNLMSFPVAAGAAAIGVHFNAADTNCPHSQAASIITTAQMSLILGGDVSNWSSIYAGCNVAITRVVRSDVSGTTQTVKNYLAKSSPSGGSCAGSNWAALDDIDSNTIWPTGGTCAANLNAQNGTGNVVATVKSTDGAIGYGDLRAWTALPAGVFLAEVQTHDSTGGTPLFVTPGVVGGASNCNINTVSRLPGTGSSSDSIGLSSPDGVNPGTGNWATDGSPNVSNITFLGNKWPLCTLTYDMLYAGTSTAAPGGPTGGLTNDQRRTLYSFFLYVLSPAGQSGLTSFGFDPLPASWLPTLRAGFAGTLGAF